MNSLALDLPKVGRPVAFHAPIVAAMDDSPVESRIGRIVAVAFFGLFLGSAAILRMDAAAHAEGSVSVAGNRQVVQHRDGGVVSGLYVREGQHVRGGQVLIDLASPDLRANERAMAAEVIGLQAERARLLAERIGGAEIEWPATFATLSPEDRMLADSAMRLQAAELRTRRTTKVARRQILAQQVAQLNARISGIHGQMDSSHQQSQLIEDELKGLRTLAARGFASINRVRELERAQAGLGGDAASLGANAATAREQIGEARLQSLALENQGLLDVAQRLPMVDQGLSEALPKWIALRRQIDEQRIRATASGQVVGLSVFTVGGVIAPGQKLLEIVPDAKPLVVQMTVAPADADELAVGQQAELRFPSLHDRQLPAFHGRITRLSADSFVDEHSGARYFTGEVSVPVAELAELRRLRGANGALKPGLPVEVLVPLRKRTLLQYLLEPLQQGLWRSGRER